MNVRSLQFALCLYATASFAQCADAQPKAAAVAGSVTHFQAAATANCSGSSCLVPFASPAADTRVNLTRVSCLLQSSNNASKYNYGRVELQKANNSLVLGQFINNVFSSDNGTHTVNDAIDLEVKDTQHITVFLSLTTATAQYAFCTVSGTQTQL